LCDFGSAKKLDPSASSVSYICSRYYRAPELIFGATKYGDKIDVWSAGCVIAELFKLSPLFPGKNSKEQITEIFKVMGTPSPEEVAAMNPEYKNREFPQLKPLPFETNFPATTNSQAIDFIKHLLNFNPKKRPCAIAALKHPFFDELLTPNLKLPNGLIASTTIFDFTQDEYDNEGVLIENYLLPEWLPSMWMTEKGVNRIHMNKSKYEARNSKSSAKKPTEEKKQ